MTLEGQAIALATRNQHPQLFFPQRCPGDIDLITEDFRRQESFVFVDQAHIPLKSSLLVSTQRLVLHEVVAEGIGIGNGFEDLTKVAGYGSHFFMNVDRSNWRRQVK